ncbi:MAG: hypothetical protein WD875_00655 [Pirellulales bacterium]
MPKTMRDVRWPFFVLLAALLALSLIAPRQWRFQPQRGPEQGRAADRLGRAAGAPAFDTLAVDWPPRIADRREPSTPTGAAARSDDVGAADVRVAEFTASESDSAGVTRSTADVSVSPRTARRADISTHVATQFAPPSEAVASEAAEGLASNASSSGDVSHDIAVSGVSERVAISTVRNADVAATETPPQPAVTGLPNSPDFGSAGEQISVARDEDVTAATTPAPKPLDATSLNATAAEKPKLAIRPSSEPIGLSADRASKHDVPHPVPVDAAHDAARDAFQGATAWPMPVRTIERLRELARNDATREWAGEMLCIFDDLRRGVAMSPEEFESTLGHMQRLLAAGERLETPFVLEPALSSQITRTRFAVERRMDAWRSLYALHQVAGGDRLASRDGGADLALRDPTSVLRILPSSQAALADEAVALMDDIETYEESPSPHTARKIALAARQLAVHPNPTARRLGENVDSNYRNANVRVAAHGTLLNRFLPQPAETAGDVNDVVAGLPVYGTQRTRTRLLLRLLPDGHNIRLGLEAHGEVDSDTAAHSGPATVYTTGETRFLVRKLLLLDERRWKLFPAIAAARNESSLSGMRTDFDPFPIINSLVHSVVRSKHEEKRWTAEREVEDRVSQQAQAQLDGEANPKFAELTAKAKATLVEPLERLGLEPTPIALATTDERVIFRYRLAGGEQLGGHTPRPRAPADSLLSVQLHESSINNALTNLDLAGQTFELKSLYESVAARLGRPDIKVPDDVPEGVRVTFAAENPLQVRLEGNAAEITLRIDRLDADRQTWRDLTVIAAYEPEVDGLDAVFARNVPIRLSGKNLTTRSNIVLRGVFSKMFTRNKQVHLLPEPALADARLADLAVNQLVVHDGWVGLAIGPRRAAGAVSTDTTIDSESASRDDGVRR